ncbi:MAG TPA: tRNA preQ1(34) S-adenosylmethionine ribosyltransferase-isomerase QueA [Dongiaceae bacterium]|jgi:S-adenosylmethionine:tRNA ribosyltransferase-isomerase|nr:tRNA preQ1(34) S-adenosylmethionine ribosyltransferase-isomerase QueA [Dongiaceae bacterium]
MKTADFDFDLPEGAIATRPVQPRDSARLLVVDAALRDCHVRDLPALLRAGDLLVLNDTRVIPAQLTGRRGQTRVEATLLKPVSNDTWQALARPARRLRIGDVIDYENMLHSIVAEKGENGELHLRFNASGEELMVALRRAGVMPLPPYIRKTRDPDEQDRIDYQTIFAREEGAVAAPTAGLHFTQELLQSLAARDIKTAYVTLHVGAGTFLPVRSEDPRTHPIHAERGTLTETAALAIAAARAQGGRIVAVGTTVLRLLEAATSADGTVRPFHGETNIYLLPGHRFVSADLLLTNFHLPRSTLFMLVCAFAGTARMREAYRHAVQQGYRFYSYGDASLLERA